jgi:hypothetical protein
MMRNRLIAVVPVCLLWVFGALADDGVLFREEFEALDAWAPLYFPKIDTHTHYEVAPQGYGQVLKVVSEASASGLVLNKKFNIRQYPVIRWRWKVDNVYAKGDYHRKSGDDYPLRIYILFPYEPEKAALGTRMKYALAKTLYGQYPPGKSLSYIWANGSDETERVFNPYTNRSLMIPLRSGKRYVGQWVEEQVNAVEDYRLAFGEEPPPQASLAVMGDADNTGEKAVAYLDYIEIRK